MALANEVNKLKQQIEMLRSEMIRLSMTKGLNGKEVIEASQKLDKVLNKYDHIMNKVCV